MNPSQQSACSTRRECCPGSNPSFISMCGARTSSPEICVGPGVIATGKALCRTTGVGHQAGVSMRAGIYESLDAVIGLAHHEYRDTGNFMTQKIPVRGNFIFATDTYPFLLENGLLFDVHEKRANDLLRAGWGEPDRSFWQAAARSFCRTAGSAVWVCGFQIIAPASIIHAVRETEGSSDQSVIPRGPTNVQSPELLRSRTDKIAWSVIARSNATKQSPRSWRHCEDATRRKQSPAILASLRGATRRSNLQFRRHCEEQRDEAISGSGVIARSNATKQSPGILHC